MAQLAGRIDADARAAGRVIPFPDLLIGTTAIHAGYAIVTANARHFQMVPGLVVLPA
jgi:predicted nucleic acid-binding protein